MVDGSEPHAVIAALIAGFTNVYAVAGGAALALMTYLILENRRRPRTTIAQVLLAVGAGATVPFLAGAGMEIINILQNLGG